MVIPVSSEPFEPPLIPGLTGYHRLDVQVTGGVVRGVQEQGVLAWRGIPYAAPPLTALRFRVPQPVLPRTGIRDASSFGNVAPQVYKDQLRGTNPGTPSGEDCLTINVQRPAVPHRTRLAMPVMVFIHGGGYSTGGSLDFEGQGTMTSLGGGEQFSNAGERMRRHWLRFACTGAVDEIWSAYDERTRLTLVIDDADRVESEPRADRRRAWQAFRPGL